MGGTDRTPAARVVAVVGPTASGKSDLAVALAKRAQGEVVSTDSMQVYRGMDVGTAKLSVAERQGVQHHLLDVWPVTRTVSVAEFQALARAAVDDCLARGVLPVLVGGSALYVRAVLDRFVFPGTEEALRRRLEDELVAVGSEALHARLAAVDPGAAARILPSNGRRVVRALEVVELTGRPFAATLPPKAYLRPATVQLGLDVPREVLDRRIEARVDRMWADGFVEEVRRLEGAGLRRGRTASRALGYAQVLAFLAGTTTEEDAKAATVRATRRFARRQDAWFRKDERVVWLPYDAPDLLDRTLALAVDAPRAPTIPA
jgi:tRNA dimethylallyltransferase